MANISYNLGRVFVILSPSEADVWADTLKETALHDEAIQLENEAFKIFKLGEEQPPRG